MVKLWLMCPYKVLDLVRPAGMVTVRRRVLVDGRSVTSTVTVWLVVPVLAIVTRSPTASISESGALPSGITFTDNHDGTATLAGTPAAGTGATYPLTLTASNGVSPKYFRDTRAFAQSPLGYGHDPHHWKSTRPG